MVYERARAALTKVYSAIQVQLDQLYIQQQSKLDLLQMHQESVLQRSMISREALQEFQASITQINRLTNSMQAHAANLSNIKLTLARAADLVGPEGKMASLVMRKEQTRPEYVENVLRPPVSNEQLTMQHSDRNQATCFVFHLPQDIDEDELRDLFMPYGTVMNVHVARENGRPRGFGFVDYASAKEAQLAISKLDKLPLKGKFLSVSIKV